MHNDSIIRTNPRCSLDLPAKPILVSIHRENRSNIVLVGPILTTDKSKIQKKRDKKSCNPAKLIKNPDCKDATTFW